jgi:hypothetical protein
MCKEKTAERHGISLYLRSTKDVRTTDDNRYQLRVHTVRGFPSYPYYRTVLSYKTSCTVWHKKDMKLAYIYIFCFCLPLFSILSKSHPLHPPGSHFQAHFIHTILQLIIDLKVVIYSLSSSHCPARPGTSTLLA